jgi:hypothetical protein
MYYVYGDLTPFYDRWGKDHTRLVGQSHFYLIAKLKAHLHCFNHSHGSAFISTKKLDTFQEELPCDELNDGEHIY